MNPLVNVCSFSDRGEIAHDQRAFAVETSFWTQYIVLTERIQARI